MKLVITLKRIDSLVVIIKYSSKLVKSKVGYIVAMNESIRKAIDILSTKNKKIYLFYVTIN